MTWRNTPSSYGLVSRACHWLLAVAMLALVGVGWYVVDVGYYDPSYKLLLNWHQSAGVALWVVAVAWLAWHHLSRPPQPVAGLNGFERVASRLSKLLLYAAMLFIPLSGYLMSVAEDGAVKLFGALTLPPLPQSFKPWADPALTFHVYASYATLGVAALHAAGALKHHFVDRNEVLLRMLRQESTPST